MDAFFSFFFLPYKPRIAGFKSEFYLKEKTQLNTQKNTAGSLSVTSKGDGRNSPTVPRD